MIVNILYVYIMIILILYADLSSVCISNSIYLVNRDYDVWKCARNFQCYSLQVKLFFKECKQSQVKTRTMISWSIYLQVSAIINISQWMWYTCKSHTFTSGIKMMKESSHQRCADKLTNCIHHYLLHFCPLISSF